MPVDREGFRSWAEAARAQAMEYPGFGPEWWRSAAVKVSEKGLGILERLDAVDAIALEAQKAADEWDTTCYASRFLVRLLTVIAGGTDPGLYPEDNPGYRRHAW
jgi:hypothetical protein